MDFVYQASVWIVPVILAITLHEAAHAWTAQKLGDDTAQRLGRVTFNPIAHIDRFGTIIVPGLLLLMNAGFLFGWAKPVPVNFRRLRNPRRDMVLVAAAGPAINIAIAIFSAWLLRWYGLLPEAAIDWARNTLYASVVINVILAVFNMLPLPPLDGGRIAVGLLPAPLARPLARLERYGFVILLGLLFLLPWIGAQMGLDLNLFGRLILEPTLWIISFIMGLMGFGG